jgi:hypothetical protein
MAEADVRVEGCGAQLAVPQPALDGTNVDTCFQEVRGKIVPERLLTLLIHPQR